MPKETIRFSDSLYGIKEEFVTAHLVIGDEYAVLFDTGVETGLKELISGLTSLPIKVYHTHTDRDHITADDEFEEIHMHPAEYDRGKVTDKHKIIPVWEGEEIKIGEYVFRAILTPGHTPGSLAYFEENKGILIPGDLCPEGTEEFMFGPGRNLAAYRESLLKINGLKDRIRVIYSAHGTDTSDSTIIDDYLEMLELIDKGELDCRETNVHGHTVKECRYKRAGIYL